MKEAENKMEEGALAPSELEKQQREREMFLSQQRDIIKTGRPRPSHHRPLSRTQSSPLVTFSMPPQQPTETGPVTYTFTTGKGSNSLLVRLRNHHWWVRMVNSNCHVHVHSHFLLVTEYLAFQEWSYYKALLKN
jgi:hypothetical protein